MTLLLDIFLILLLTLGPICGVIFFIIGIFRLSQNAKLREDTPEKSIAIMYWGLALLALAFIGWVVMYNAFYIAAGAAV